jgi:hypothetical protein
MRSARAWPVLNQPHICRWEFFSTIWFEWGFITGKRPYRWSIWVSRLTFDLVLLIYFSNCNMYDTQIYSAIRLATLVNVFADIVRAQVLNPLGCQVFPDLYRGRLHFC